MIGPSPEWKKFGDSSSMSGKTKQDEVRDEQGRRRFHGAFTGGFSAGYFNSVGSQEGWTPSTFQSSRATRAGGKRQRPEDFMDEDDGLLGRELEAQLAYDTLGHVSKRIARENAEKEAVGSAIPGIVVDELVAPTDVSIGKKLLQLMGWREGLGVGSRQHRRRAAGEAGVDGEEADMFLSEHLRTSTGRPDLVQQGQITYARTNAEVVVLPPPKDDLYGLEFDPVQHAPEMAAFRASARAVADRGVYRMSDVAGHGKGTSSRAGPRDVTGFALDDGEDDVYDGGTDMAGYSMELQDVEDDKGGRGRNGGGRGAPSAKREALEQWIEAGGAAASSRATRCPTDSRPVPEGFVLAEGGASAFKKQYWPPPTPPRDFVPIHRFEQVEPAAAPLQRDTRGRLLASARGDILGEAAPKPPHPDGADGKAASSVFDLMSEEDKKRILGAKSQPDTQRQDESKAEDKQVAPLAQSVVFQGLQAALAKRFTAVDTAVSNKKDREEAKPKPLKEPVRSQQLWFPVPLLCKRFHVPVPQQSALGVMQQRAAATTGNVTTETSMSDRFKKEVAAFLPGPAAAALVGGEASRAEDGGMTLLDEDQGSRSAEGMTERDVELPSFEEMARPPIDFFKAIFEDEDEDGQGVGGAEEGNHAAAAAPATTTPKESPMSRPEVSIPLAADAPTPPNLSPARDHFLQPASEETAEDILAKGPVLIRRKRRLVDSGEGEQDEEDGDDGVGLTFGAGAIKHKAKKRTASAAASATSHEKLPVARPESSAPAVVSTPVQPAPQLKEPSTEATRAMSSSSDSAGDSDALRGGLSLPPPEQGAEGVRETVGKEGQHREKDRKKHRRHKDKDKSRKDNKKHRKKHKKSDRR